MTFWPCENKTHLRVDSQFYQMRKFNFNFLTIIIALSREVVVDTLRNDARAISSPFGIHFVQTREECQEKGLEKLKNGIQKSSPVQHYCEYFQYFCECVNRRIVRQRINRDPDNQATMTQRLALQFSAGGGNCLLTASLCLYVSVAIPGRQEQGNLS